MFCEENIEFETSIEGPLVGISTTSQYLFRTGLTLKLVFNVKSFYLLCWSTILWSLITGAECWQPKTFLLGKLCVGLFPLIPLKKQATMPTLEARKSLGHSSVYMKPEQKQFAVSPPLLFIFFWESTVSDLGGRRRGKEERSSRREFSPLSPAC